MDAFPNCNCSNNANKQTMGQVKSRVTKTQTNQLQTTADNDKKVKIMNNVTQFPNYPDDCSADHLNVC